MSLSIANVRTCLSSRCERRCRSGPPQPGCRGGELPCAWTTNVTRESMGKKKKKRNKQRTNVIKTTHYNGDNNDAAQQKKTKFI